MTPREDSDSKPEPNQSSEMLADANARTDDADATLARFADLLGRLVAQRWWRHVADSERQEEEFDRESRDNNDHDLSRSSQEDV